ncbi:MAG: hypothetical protein ACP5NV_05180 [Candidatus Woesearchaeota archaeon]
MVKTTSIKWKINPDKIINIQPKLISNYGLYLVSSSYYLDLNVPFNKMIVNLAIQQFNHEYALEATINNCIKHAEGPYSDNEHWVNRLRMRGSYRNDIGEIQIEFDEKLNLDELTTAIARTRPNMTVKQLRKELPRSAISHYGLLGQIELFSINGTRAFPVCKNIIMKFRYSPIKPLEIKKIIIKESYEQSDTFAHDR